ncbi:MAG: BspA family leucine-rich repeat surface protein [Cyclonatronaceae bacterium]
MKVFTLALLIVAVITCTVTAQEGNNTIFITIWKTDNEGVSDDNQITIPGEGTGYQISWQEVDNPDNFGSETGTDEHTVTFPSPGIYRVAISGDFTRIHFGLYTVHGGGDEKKILDVEQWGNIVWTTMQSAFMNASNLVISATDVPDLSQVEDMFQMFMRAESLTGDFSGWDVSNVTTLGAMFWLAGTFDSDLSSWNVSNVTDMQTMFAGAGSFNSDLSGWDVSNVTNFGYMFSGAGSFTSDLSGWDVSNATRILNMFTGAGSFTSDLSGWDVSNASNLSSMFSGAGSFTSDLSGWDVSNVTDMDSMFRDATSFNSDLSTWDVSNVTNMRLMFQGASSFTSDLSGWNVSNVTNMGFMFEGAIVFNSDLNSWDVRNVTNMNSMFRGATSFSGDLSTWDVSSVTNMRLMFQGVREFNSDLSGWDVSSVTTMASMFHNASVFDQSLASWNIENVTLMRDPQAGGMLQGTALSTDHYDQTLIAWSEQQLQNGIEFRANGLTYCASEQARQSIIDTFGWTFTGDSLSDDCTTSIGENDEIPVRLTLEQNYPNPFNPETMIRFALPEQADVRLTVYNLTGQNVVTLIDESRSPGWHTVRFDASGIASGLYFYQIYTGSDVLTRHMLLIK